MNTKRKIIIDTLVGTPITTILNIIARILGSILKIDHSLNKEFKTIVVSKYAGLGSIIQSTPLLQTLRLNFPQARLIFITVASNKTLIERIPEVDTILTVEDKSLITTIQSSMILIRKLWKFKPELFIDIEFYSNYSGIITTLSMATNRLGFYNEDKASRKGIHNYLLPFKINKPISETYLQFAELLKCKNIKSNLKIISNPSLSITDLENKVGFKLASNYLIINPNASDLRVERRWPKEYFIKIISRILNEFPDFNLVLIGNKNELKYVNEIISQIEPSSKLINTAGRLNLNELIFLIQHSKLMLTNDTGPMHIAYALNTKTISLFGPCSPQQYGAFNNGKAFYKKVDCSPCVHKHIFPPCKGNNICMKNISVIEVFQEIYMELTV